ncbi:unnamed protein product [Sphagnum jensenii]|uniref:Nucleolar complex protein 2 n=1 Tax=Sphagnum jensenii TaxID=128206 RepID=A0ABP0VI74_9BRYO
MKHRAQLKSLKQKDPEFYRFLQENDQNLLRFEDNEGLENREESISLDHNEKDEGMRYDGENELQYMTFDDTDAGDTPELESASKKTKLSKNRRNKTALSASPAEKELIDVSMEIFHQDLERAKLGMFPAVKRIFAYFQAACVPHNEEDEEDEEENTREAAAKPVSNPYTVKSPDVYNEIMVQMVESVHQIFTALFLSNDASSDPSQNSSRAQISNSRNFKRNKREQNTTPYYDFTTASTHPKWGRYEHLISSYFKSLASVLHGIENINTDIGVFILNHMQEYITLLYCIPKTSRMLLRVLIKIWAEGPAIMDRQANANTTAKSSAKSPMNTNTNANHANVNGNTAAHSIRSHALLLIRQMSTVLPGTFTEDSFRSIYMHYAKVCDSYNELVAPTIHYMIESIAQLYTTNPANAYQQTFVSIRQLALLLRAVILKKNSEHAKSLTSWQYLNCIRLWTRVLSLLPTPQQLGDLFYPLTQIILGLLSTIQSHYYLPLKFHLIACLHVLAANAPCFIPVAPRIYEVFDIADLHHKSTPSTEIPIPFKYAIKIATNSIHTKQIKDVIVQETIQLITNDAEIYKYNPAYPEYVYLTVKKLRSFLKGCKVIKWRDLCKACINQLEEHSQWVKEKRLTMQSTIGGNNVFEPLLPPNTQNVSARMNKLMNSLYIDNMYTNRVVVADNQFENHSVPDASTKGDTHTNKKKKKNENPLEMPVREGNAVVTTDSSERKKKNAIKIMDKPYAAVKSDKKMNVSTGGSGKKEKSLNSSTDIVEDFYWSDNDS